MKSRRFRRLRLSEHIRQLVQETRLNENDVIQPFFVIEGKNKIQPIPSMPGINRFSIDKLLKEMEQYIQRGGRGALLFGVSQNKDLTGEYAIKDNGLIPQTIRAVKKHFPGFLVITDVCLCAYLKHGHCGIIKNDRIENDLTLPILSQMAVMHAQAGADFIAPSDMMDHRVAHIRHSLDEDDFPDTGIISYAVKYASSFYGPFRDAAKSAPEFGDRKSYQMDNGNVLEAVKEAQEDVNEGADIVMVKPALAYLDVIARIKQNLHVPVAAYHVSGEYSMIKAAAHKGWIDERKVAVESLIAIKRAGASIIFTYYAKDVLKWIIENR